MGPDPERGALQEEMAKLVQEGRKPWSRDEMRALITQLDQTLLHRWTQFKRAGIAIGVGAALAAHYEPVELNRIGFKLYEKFRPDVPAGNEGWAAKARLEVEKILSAA